VIDPKLLRSDPDAVARNLARRGYALDVEALKTLEEQRKPYRWRPIACVPSATPTRGCRHGKGRGEDVAPLIARVRS